MNCGLCGRPVFNNQPICDGCKKARNMKGKKVQRKFEREEKIKKAWGLAEDDTEDEEVDAQDVWVDDV